jgi:hypothetical protein
VLSDKGIFPPRAATLKKLSLEVDPVKGKREPAELLLMQSRGAGC